MYLGASRICPLNVFDSDLEAQVNMRRGVTDGLDGDSGNNPAGTKSTRKYSCDLANL
jgi:hypothetical protein